MKRLIFTFGRFNPPTVGHGKLIQTVESLAKQQQCDYKIFASHSHKKDKNPLPYDVKIKWMKEMYFRQKDHIYNDREGKIKTAFQVLENPDYLEEYQAMTMVVGSDRVSSFTEAIKKQAEKPNPNFAYKDIQVTGEGLDRVESSGSDLDLDDYDIYSDRSEFSGTMMRKAAENVHTRAFLLGVRGLLTTQQALDLMADVRDGMGL